MKVKVKDICDVIEKAAPLDLQESYDNAGIQCGDANMNVKSVLLSIDVTENVVDEAIAKGCEMIISHHPLIFGGLKRLVGDTDVERSVIKALKNDIAIYSSHTNMDKAVGGVSYKMAEKLGLGNVEVMCGEKKLYCQVTTFVPLESADAVANAMYAAGGGCIGNYDRCSYRTEGTGTFRAGYGCHPYVGEIGEECREKEIRVEMVVEKRNVEMVRDAVAAAHPYEEPVIDVYELMQTSKNTGLGVVGDFETPMTEIDALKVIKSKFNCSCVRSSPLTGKMIKKVAVCGGAGSEFIELAASSGADMYVTADCKYHEFFRANGRILVVDIGHYESEQFTKEIFRDLLSTNFPEINVEISETKTNPINYL